MENPAAPLLRTLETRALLPLQDSVASHTVLVRNSRDLLRLPSGIRAVPLELKSRRVAMRKVKRFQRATLPVADWPEDHMRALRVSKLVIVIGGHSGFRAGDYVLQSPEGTAIFIPAGVPHTTGEVSHVETLPPEYNKCSYLWFTPMISGIACRICHWEDNQHFINRQGERVFLHNPRVMQLFTTLAEEAEELCHEDSPAVIRDGDIFSHLLLAFLRLCQRDISEGRFLAGQTYQDEGDSSTIERDSMDRVVQYVEANFARELNLDDVARRFLMSRAQFTRKFRQHTGHSFLEFVNRVRLERARSLLVHTDWTAAMVAQNVGFKSVPSFHRLFHREEGLTPMEYRRVRREES